MRNPTVQFPREPFQGFDKLDEGQGVGVEVLDEGSALGDRRRVRLEDVSQLVPDQFEDPVAVERALIGVGFGWHGDQCTSRAGRNSPFIPFELVFQADVHGAHGGGDVVASPPAAHSWASGPRSSSRLPWRTRG